MARTNQPGRGACAPARKPNFQALNQSRQQASDGIAPQTQNVKLAEAAMPPTRASDVANRRLHFTAASVSSSFKRVVSSALHSENYNLLLCLTLKLSHDHEGKHNGKAPTKTIEKGQLVVIALWCLVGLR
jgi:hypothetical protein